MNKLLSRFEEPFKEMCIRDRCMSVLLKGLIITGSCSLLQQMDGNRIIQMLLLSRTHLMAANTVQLSLIHI